jgi:hypothetical protein
MPGLIFYDEIKQALFPNLDEEKRKNIRLSRVEKALAKRGLPFEYGENGVFAMQDSWVRKIAGSEESNIIDEPIRFVRKAK